MTEPKNLAEALAVLQTRLPRVTKGETASVKSEKGSYSYTYATLADISAQILPILGGLGLSFTARPTLSDGAFVLAYELLHTSGENRTGEYPLPTGGTPQALGSAITYGRRYCRCAVTGVAPDDDDDDGGAAAETAARNQRQAPAEQHTDHAWLDNIEARIKVARSRAELAKLADEIRRKKAAGQCEQVHEDHLWEVGKQRKEIVDSGVIDGLPVNKDGSVSRSRMTDEERQAAGIPTKAQARADNAAVKNFYADEQRAERGPLPADEDPWASGGES